MAELGVDGGYVQLFDGTFHLDYSRKRVLFKHLPASILHKEQLGDSRGINVFPIKIDVLFILESLGVLGGVHTQLNYIKNRKVVLFQTKGVKLFVICETDLTLDPMVFLRSLLVT